MLSGPQVRTRAAILAATASVLADDRSATLPDIARAAGVGRTTVHRYFNDRESLVREATSDAVRILEAMLEGAGVDDGPAVDAMRRVIAAMVAIGDRIVFLFGDPRVMESLPPHQQPNGDVLVTRLIERGQRDGTFDSELPALWIKHTLWSLVLRGCQDVRNGDLPTYAVTAAIIRTFEHGVGQRI